MEFQNTYGALDDTQFVTLLYTMYCTGRPIRVACGLASLLGSGTLAQHVVVGFSESPEYRATRSRPLRRSSRTLTPGDANVLDGGDGSDTASYTQPRPG